jgi:hypothetical protein
MTDTIDWDAALARPAGLDMRLNTTEIGVEHSITFDRCTQTDSGTIVATVRCDSIEGDTLWLRGKFGPQNGLPSLVNAAGSDGIEGRTFTFTRVESEKSPAGYAYRWTA